MRDRDEIRRAHAPLFDVDVVVVGSGSSGSAVAGRLSEDGGCRILVLEAGGTDKTLAIQMPAASYLYALWNPRYDWRYRSLPDPTRRGRSDGIPRGKVLGGTSSINGMCYVRGQPEDFDDWAALGCKGWDFESVLPYFRKSEANENGESALHGAAGPLKVSNLRVQHHLSDAFLRSWHNCGHFLTGDINAVPQRGMGYLQATQFRGQRWSASRAYLWKAAKRPNLQILKKAHVTRILFDGTRATGVEFLRGDRLYSVRARRGVVLSAGAIASPQLLMLSGVGPAEELSKHGIIPLVDLEGVGRNFHDHPGITLTVETTVNTYNVQNSPFHRAWFGLQWLLLGRGPGSTPDTHLIGFAATDKGSDRANIQYHFGPVGYEFGEAGAVLFKQPSATGFVNLSRPRSRGWITLNSADPLQPPAIQPNLLADPRDVDDLAAGAKLMRQVFKTDPIAGLIRQELTPGQRVRSDEDWRSYIADTASGIFHPAGTCKMGTDNRAVVDHRLRVRGAENLFVVDASIMPIVTSANLNANCIMIGEKFADMFTTF